MDYTKMLNKHRGYIYPMKVGDKCGGFNEDMLMDSTVVKKKITIEVFEGLFYEGFELFEWGGMHGYDYSLTIWFVPSIGMVQMFSNSPFFEGEFVYKLIDINFVPE